MFVETEFDQIESEIEDSTFQKADAVKTCIKSSALYAVDDTSQKKKTISGQVKGLTTDTVKGWYRVSIEGQTVMVPKLENDISRNTGDTMYFHVPESAVYLVRS